MKEDKINKVEDSEPLQKSKRQDLKIEEDLEDIKQHKRHIKQKEIKHK